MNFSAWISQKFNDWRGEDLGQEVSVTQFASWVGVDQATMDKWLKGKTKKPRAQHTIYALVNRYGDEVYEVLDIQPLPAYDPGLDILRDKLAELTSSQRDEVLRVIEQIQDRDERQLDRRTSFKDVKNREGETPPEQIKK